MIERVAQIVDAVRKDNVSTGILSGLEDQIKGLSD